MQQTLSSVLVAGYRHLVLGLHYLHLEVTAWSFS
jgi:hypothetical protein